MINESLINEEKTLPEVKSLPNENELEIETIPLFENKEALEKMHHVLAPNQIDVLKKIHENLKLHYETGQVFRSEVEMKFSVLNDGKFPNADAKYWQAVREQNVHFTNLVILSYEYDTEVIHMKNINDMIRKHELKQKRIRKNIEEAALGKNDWDELDIEEAQIELDMIQNKIDTLGIELEKLEFFQSDRKRVASNRWREVVTWEKIMLELQPKMKFGVLSYEHHQPGSYETRMQKQFDTMIKSGAKGSPSEAINITNQNHMIKKLIEQGLLKPTRELPIDLAVKKVLDAVESGNNYAKKAELLESRFPVSSNVNVEDKSVSEPVINDRLDDVFKENIKDKDSLIINNPQIP